MTTQLLLCGRQSSLNLSDHAHVNHGMRSLKLRDDCAWVYTQDQQLMLQYM